MAGEVRVVRPRAASPSARADAAAPRKRSRTNGRAGRPSGPDSTATREAVRRRGETVLGS